MAIKIPYASVFTDEMCRIFGLNPLYVRSLSIDVRAGETVLTRVELIPDDAQLQRVAKLYAAIEWKENKD